MIVPFGGYVPHVSPDAFIAPTAILIGNVTVETGASIWYGAVLRGDNGDRAIVIGAGSNVQDNAVIHVALDRGTVVGANVTVGHGAVLEACDIGDGAVIGMNAVVLEHAQIGRRAMVAAGSTVLAHTVIPDDVLAAGSPASAKKRIDGAALRWIERSAPHYVELAQQYRDAGLDRLNDADLDGSPAG
jgi:carbonic anhydrase/acetyltransferase-like protein (isoleucine patch superfamily)